MPRLQPPMLFHSTIRKELARSFGASLVVLVTVIVTMTLIRTLSLANRGSVNPQEVMMVMGYTVLGYLATILSLSLFIAIVGTLSRMYRDSEMVIWFSAGRGLSSLMKPVLRFSWPVLFVIALLSVVIWPWANHQIEEMKDRYGRRGDLERVAPGEFQQSASGQRVFFIDKDTPDNKSGKNIFISTMEKDRETVISARTGRVETVGDAQFLLLSNGQRMETSLKGEGMRISEFEVQGSKVTGNSFTAMDQTPAKVRTTADLLRNRTPINDGELAWRLGMAFAAVNFILLAVTVSSVNPRVGRSGNLLFALFAFVVYYNMLNLGVSWISSGRAKLLPFVLLLHGGTFLAGIFWLTKQHNNWAALPLLQRMAVRK
jgi:lipopolysaccharide export system permease protein